MKVLLADPPQREREYDAAYPNMGILYLIGSARQAFAGSEMTFEYLESQYDLPGLAFRRDGAPFRTAKRAPIPNLDSIPAPAWDLVDFAKYKGMHLKCAEPQTYIAVSRGCPFDCWFCSNPIWKESKPWVRLRGPRPIAQEVEQLYRRGIREVYLSADEFNVNCEWPVAVAREFKNMNVWMVHIGVESGNQRTIDGLKKHIRLDQVIEACRIFQARPPKPRRHPGSGLDEIAWARYGRSNPRMPTVRNARNWSRFSTSASPSDRASPSPGLGALSGSGAFDARREFPARASRLIQ